MSGSLGGDVWGEKRLGAVVFVGDSEDFPFEEPAEGGDIEGDVAHTGHDDIFLAILGGGVEPDLAIEAGLFEGAAHTEEVLFVDVDVLVNGGDGAGVFGVFIAIAHEGADAADPGVGVGVVPAVGGGVDDETAVWLQNTANFEHGVLEFPRVEMFDDVEHEDTVEIFGGEREFFSIREADAGFDLLVGVGLAFGGDDFAAHAGGDGGVVDAVGFDAEAHTMADNFATATADIEEAHAGLDVGGFEGVAEAAGEMLAFGVDEDIEAFTGGEKIFFGV